MTESAAGLDLLVLIISYRTSTQVHSLLSALSSLGANDRVRFTVVDNADDVELRNLVTAFPWARLVQSKSNLGYAAAINLGLQESKQAAQVMILNPDLQVSPSAIRELCFYANSSGHGCVVPRVLDSSGQESFSLRREPTVVNALGESLFGDHWASRPAVLSEIIRRPSRDASSADHCDWAVGAAVLLQSVALNEVGNWDERFFLYSEETDYMRRLRLAGYSVQQCPTAVVSHEGGGSGKSTDLVALLHLNRIRYFLKWHGIARALPYAAVIVLGLLLRVNRPGERKALVAIMSCSVRSSVLQRVGFPRHWAWQS